MIHLVGCAEQIRAYEKAREQDDKAAAVEALARRQEAKDKAASEAAALKAQAAEQALAGTGGGAGTDAATTDESSDGVLKQHRSKTGAVWSAFDLTVEKPTCKLFQPGSEEVCGCEPSASAGTTNYWSHLWTKHRTTWYELEKLSGGLNAAGEAELAALKAGLANMAMGGTLLNHSAGGERWTPDDRACR